MAEREATSTYDCGFRSVIQERWMLPRPWRFLKAELGLVGADMQKRILT